MQVTNRSDRSAATALVHFFIRPFAPHLTKIKKVYDAGSPRLNPPKSAYKNCKITERKIEDVWVYDITPVKASRTHGKKRTKRIYYFAGGSWQTPPTGDHFKLLSALVCGLSEPTIITLVSCPLAPKSPAQETFPKLVPLYKAISAAPQFDEEDVCFAGDSSGGNIALALTMYCLSDTSSLEAPAPHSLLLISPTVDLLHQDPDMERVEKYDPIESLELVRRTANAWAGDWEKSDPRLSPGLGTVKVLADRGVRVNGIIAGYDVLSCEAKTFVQRCEEAGVEGRFLIWDRQMHVFPLTAPYNIPEAKEAVEWLIEALEEGRRDGEGSLGGHMHDEDQGLKEVSTPSKGKNKPGGRHGHRIFGRNDRKLVATTRGMNAVTRDTDTMKKDADKLKRQRHLKATETEARPHRELDLT